MSGGNKLRLLAGKYVSKAGHHSLQYASYRVRVGEMLTPFPAAGKLTAWTIEPTNSPCAVTFDWMLEISKSALKGLLRATTEFA